MIYRLIKNFVQFFSSRVLLTLTNLTVVLAISKFLSASELGIYGISFFFYNLAAVLSSNGLGHYFSKEIAYKRGNKKYREKVFKEITGSFFLGSVLTFLVFIITLVFYRKIEFNLLVIASFSGLIQGGERNIGGVLLGEERMEVETLSQALNFIIVGVCSLLFVTQIGIIGIYYLRVSASIINIIIRLVYLKVKHNFLRPILNLKYLAKKEKSFFFASDLLFFAAQYIDVFILSFLISKEALGEYFLALRVYFVFGLLAEIMSTSLIPFVSRIYRGKEDNSLHSFNRKVLFYFTVSGVFLSALLMLSRNVIINIFSRDYIDSSGQFLFYFSFILTFRFISCYTGNILTATGYQNKRFFIDLMKVILFIVLCVILSYFYSIYGIIISRAIGQLFLFSAFFITMKKVEGDVRYEKT